MSSVHAHKHSGSVSQNQKAQLANAYNELGKELSSSKIRVVGNYTLGKVIGEGAYGKVRMGTHRLTSTRVAVKQIPKAMSAALTREIHHHRQLHHPNITQMYEVIATESSVWIVAELCSGGELFDYLVEKGRLAEDETKIMFGQLCLAVAYLHDKGIVHRDLKLENVLLDERCRVKLGDFGFTREFDRGTLMETFCGTTGYASPEMLQGKKYQGPEVDVWSLGVILYCLLTGTLPFDDDDEAVMRDKIIQGGFEDPEWLSLEARDLIKGILVMDTSKRLTIPQILGHPWFNGTATFQQESAVHLSPNDIPAPRTPSPTLQIDSNRSSEASSHSESTFDSAASSSPPTTPDHSIDDPFIDSVVLHPNPSEATIRKPVEIDPINTKVSNYPETVVEEDDNAFDLPSPPVRTSSSGSKAPPIHPTRTPARTKRRSMSSTLSDPDAPESDKTMTLPAPQQQELDFPSLLTTPAPIIFSTPLERDLLNNLSALGFDLGQIVYSVLNDACDASGALWWILKRKAEKRLLEEAEGMMSPSSAAVEKELDFARSRARGKAVVNAGTQTEAHTPSHLSLSRGTPHFALVPPTPTVPQRPGTPPTTSPTSKTLMLTPSSSLIIDSSRSHPNTPSGSLKERDSTKGRKNRSGSVSIMQRATTALEAAGLVRKKSSETMDKEREKEKEKRQEADRKSQHTEEPRTSHGSTSSSGHRLTKSPPVKASRGPSTPPPSELYQHVGSSPWVLADSRESSPHRDMSPLPTVLNSPNDFLGSVSAPDLSPTAKGTHGTHRNRANLLTAFRHWFNEDRKGKRKENNATAAVPKSNGAGRGRPVLATTSYSSGSVKRRTSDGRGGKTGVRGGRRAHRGSVSSRRSSSVNSRRSSLNSNQLVLVDSPTIHPGRRSFGAHTPNSERGEYPSRPSSVRSFSQRHRKSPSASSSGSQHYRTASPSLQKYHRRGGSGSSTRVVRQIQTRPVHGRSNSTTSSLHSPPSSRPTSFHEYSDNEGYRTGSPFRSYSRHSMDETPRKSGNTTFVASKRTPAYLHGGSTIGRSSWKKSWGLEPPGWQTRTAHHPIEVLSISPPEGTSIRDVFSGRQSFSLGDESDWVDEDDDELPYAGGLGQTVHHGHPLPGTVAAAESNVTLSPAPRGHRPSKRAGKPNQSQTSGSGRGKGHSGSGRSSPVGAPEPTPEARGGGGRRQLPAGRSGPAFKVAIQEEDEEEDEE